MYYDIPLTLWDEVDELEFFVQRHLDSRLDAASLKARRVPFGCYEQRKDGAYMLRIRCLEARSHRLNYAPRKDWPS